MLKLVISALIRMEAAYLKVWTPTQVQEGFGAQVTRLIGSMKPQMLDPFVLLDVFKATQPSGFPDHPHRGFEMLTYCLSGRIWCEDSLGTSQVLQPGDVACLSAGKGVLHAIVPATHTCEGIQIWVNVPSERKLESPYFVSARNEDLPIVQGEGWDMKVICGRIGEETAPIQTKTPTSILDLEISPGASLNLPEFPGHSLCFHALTGAVTIATTELKQGSAAELRSFPSSLPLFSLTGCRLLVLAGQPIREDIVCQGPFVMTNRAELLRAAKDYTESANGFEACSTWRSQAARQVCSL